MSSEDKAVAGTLLLAVAIVWSGFQIHRWMDHIEYERCISVGGEPDASGGCHRSCENLELEKRRLEKRLRTESVRRELCEEDR